MNAQKKHADDLPYWKTGRSSEKALQEAKNAITKTGGIITGEGFMMMAGTGAFFIQFKMDGDEFRFVENVITPRNKKDESAAKIQAAASLKHAVKARVNEAIRHGARRAFLGALLLPDGSTVNQQDNETLAGLFGRVNPSNALESGIIEGDYE